MSKAVSTKLVNFLDNFVKSRILGGIRPAGGCFYLDPENHTARGMVTDFVRMQNWRPGIDYLLLMPTPAIHHIGGQYERVGTGYSLGRRYGTWLLLRDPKHARLFSQAFGSLPTITETEMTGHMVGNARWHPRLELY
jgi:hypothetical protein